ncbi:MAG: hypothetical protein DHS20C19_30590 [Acidimicrobiales bacterium]|nr:MAG: hypothetical protein DHS20C19_30590 [Acidimicrobiales bacterium]
MADLTLTDLTATTKTTVRAADDTAVAAALRLTFGSAAQAENGDLVVRIRPDEWLVLGTTATVDGLDLTGFASRIDTTHSRLLFRLTGSAAGSVMEKVCSLDFADHMTPNGACAGASVAKVTCDVVRDDVSGVRSYLLLADTSYRDYLRGALQDAMTEFIEA